ncbi:MAG TPA: PA2169 family four-helix-bundle protein [Agriterribacter sp.]|nr:PA2169 family four-helix-bundle protein [Agriterribacter sp.]
MLNTKKTAAILNDLIQINNDRIEGYEKAAQQTDIIDADLRGLFMRLANISRDNVTELTTRVNETGHEAKTDSTTVSGDIYRVWMDVKATFGGKDRRTILESCEYGEDAAQEAYQSALEEAEEDNISPDAISVIVKQKANLRRAHDEIKLLRDSQTA